MLSSRSYLIRAMYEWIQDNHLTPYILVRAEYPETAVPQRFVQKGQIVLNISFQAVQNLRLGNHSIEFDARFSGIVEHIFVPIRAIESIYAQENGRGMTFSEDSDEDSPPDKEESHPAKSKNKSVKKPTHLKIVE